jgi:5-methyltetrahydropteroyltriglutamate--homocysteine methyltransferase
MKLSTDRILTTHVGSLPRPQEVVDLLFAQDRGEPYDRAAFDATIERAVADAVQQQARAGVDVVSDGEMSKISYGTYIRHRLHGFEEGNVPRATPADLDDFPEYRDRIAAIGATPKYIRPICKGPIAVKSTEPLEKDLGRFRRALAGAPVQEGFLTAASPGTIAMFQPNDHYPSHQAYLEALASAMREEYEAIVQAGFLLQVDCPDLAMGRHVRFRDADEDEFVRNAEIQVEALNHALERVPAGETRMHVCWGNYEGPHTRDIAVRRILPVLFKAKPMALLFEGSNPRHEWEWEEWQRADVPDDKVLVPGVIDSSTNFVEHPELVAQRIQRYVDAVGRERVIAGTDCGFGTFAGFGAVHPTIAWRKLAAMAEGAALASERIWGRAGAARVSA